MSSKDEWATVMVEGITPLEGDTMELWDDRELIADCEVRVYFDVPLVFFGIRHSEGVLGAISPHTPICTLSVISVRYIVLAERYTQAN